ncbi:unnamed protein product [Cuscuta epithymum]|uniref:Leucine-rich repeat-containing N-terminal plant-type domain-containing protein n=1 Tax=Cuscuta epithymum TaxID=186058 RepID=A0AAV0FZ10_9ASTE|nr:unnamed protein product [Cuscuta epithymum]
MGLKFILLAILYWGSLFGTTRAELNEDKQALLDFINNIHHSRKLNWNEQALACESWVGVTCNHDKSRIISVRLPEIGMVGSIPPNSLSRLSALQILSLRSNHISGLFPYDLLKLENLTMLSLQSNNFHGPLPASLSVWRSIYALDLSNNAFNGSIPSSMTDLTHLTVLNLANNTFSGDIPDLNLPSLQILNLSHNNLTGNVPQSLDRFPNSAFAGNQLSRDILFTPAPSVLPPGFLSNKKSKKLGGYVLLGITIGVCGLGFVVIFVLLVLSCSRKEDDNGIPAKPLKRDESLSKVAYRKTRNERGNVVFFDGCNLSFDLEDLLRASAEIIGKGAFGTTYKVALEDATTVVVKRLKEVSVRKREFV